MWLLQCRCGLMIKAVTVGRGWVIRVLNVTEWSVPWRLYCIYLCYYISMYVDVGVQTVCSYAGLVRLSRSHLHSVWDARSQCLWVYGRLSWITAAMILINMTVRLVQRLSICLPILCSIVHCYLVSDILSHSHIGHECKYICDHRWLPTKVVDRLDLSWSKYF